MKSHCLPESETRCIPELVKALSLYPHDSRKVIERAFREAILNGSAFEIEVPILTAKGHKMMVRLEGSPEPINAPSSPIVRTPRNAPDRNASEDRLSYLSILNAACAECNALIMNAENREELMEQICFLLVEHGGIGMAWIGMVEPETDRVLPAVAHGDGTGYLRDIEISLDGSTEQGRGPVGTSIRENRPVWTHNFLSDPATSFWHERAARFGWKTCASIPLTMHGRPVGALALYSVRQMQYHEEVFNLVIGLAANISFAFENFEKEAERKKMQEELVNLRTAVEQGASSILITDAQGRIEYVNPAFERTTGYAAEEAIGQNPRILKSGEAGEAFYRQLWATINSGQSWKGEFHNRRKDGTLFWEQAVISPVLDEQGKIAHFIGVMDDVTDRKALEASLHEALGGAEAANRTKTEFLAVMSHELRTPLNGILGFAELLMEDRQLSSEAHDNIRIIQSSGQSLLRILEGCSGFRSRRRGGAEDERNSIFHFTACMESDPAGGTGCK